MTATSIVALTIALTGPAAAVRADFPVCGSGPRITCVVDGDTVWFEGVKYRFEEIDTPEKGGLAECMQEGLQAIEARSAWLRSCRAASSRSRQAEKTDTAASWRSS